VGQVEASLSHDTGTDKRRHNDGTGRSSCFERGSYQKKTSGGERYDWCSQYRNSYSSISLLLSFGIRFIPLPLLLLPIDSFLPYSSGLTYLYQSCLSFDGGIEFIPHSLTFVISLSLAFVAPLTYILYHTLSHGTGKY